MLLLACRVVEYVDGVGLNAVSTSTQQNKDALHGVCVIVFLLETAVTDGKHTKGGLSIATQRCQARYRRSRAWQRRIADASRVPLCVANHGIQPAHVQNAWLVCYPLKCHDITIISQRVMLHQAIAPRRERNMVYSTPSSNSSAGLPDKFSWTIGFNAAI